MALAVRSSGDEFNMTVVQQSLKVSNSLPFEFVNVIDVNEHPDLPGQEPRMLDMAQTAEYARTVS